MLFAQAGRRLYPDIQHRFYSVVIKACGFNTILVSALQIFMRADARIADIPFEEELRMGRGPSPRNNQSFDQLSSSELRDLTSFPRRALDIIKKFLNFPQHMFIHHTTGEIITGNRSHAGCHLFFDEELILFGLGKLANGLTTTVMIDGFFGGDRRRWSIGFRFF